MQEKKSVACTQDTLQLNNEIMFNKCLYKTKETRAFVAQLVRAPV
jgi:hypothetical protein